MSRFHVVVLLSIAFSTSLSACVEDSGPPPGHTPERPDPAEDGAGDDDPLLPDPTSESDGGDDDEDDVDASDPTDAGVDDGDDGAGSSDGNASGFPGPLSECPGKPSIDRFQSWLASGEGTTVPPTGSILVADGDDHVGRIEFVNDEWHVLSVFAANVFEGSVDLSASSGFWLTYSATADLYVQLRPSFAWSGGDKYLTTIPSTGGEVVTRFFSFEDEAWTTLPSLGTPSYSFGETIAAVRGFVFVGPTANVITFHGLRVDGYEPPCL